MSILGYKINPRKYFNPNFINAVLYGRNDYQPKVRDILARYGNKKIVSMEVRRTPLSQILMSLLKSDGILFGYPIIETFCPCIISAVLLFEAFV